MTELRQALHALVERPLAPPVATEIVAVRSARFRRRRRALLGAVGLAVVVVGSAVGIGVAREDDEGDLVLATGGATTAGYVAENPGGYLATGEWRVTITRAGQVIELSSAWNDYCGPIGVIQPGDEVRGSITGPGSMLQVGERFACPS